MAATVSGGLPLTGSWSRTSVTIPGRGELKGDDDSIDRRTVSPEYLRTLRIPILKGRQLESTDAENSEPVVVINDAAAKKYFPGEEALGKRIKINDKERDDRRRRSQHPSPRSGNAAETGSLYPVSAGFDPSARRW